MKIGEKIKNIRKDRRITIVDLAKHVGVSAPTFSNIETNKKFVTLEILTKIVSYPEFKTPLSEFLPYYYRQKLREKVKVKEKNGKVFIIIPHEVADAFIKPESYEVYCFYLEDRIIIQYDNTTDLKEGFYLEKKKIVKDRHSFYFLLGQKLKYLLNKKIKIELSLNEKILYIFFPSERKYIDKKFSYN